MLFHRIHCVLCSLYHHFHQTHSRSCIYFLFACRSFYSHSKAPQMVCVTEDLRLITKWSEDYPCVCHNLTREDSEICESLGLLTKFPLLLLRSPLMHGSTVQYYKLYHTFCNSSFVLYGILSFLLQEQNTQDNVMKTQYLWFEECFPSTGLVANESKRSHLSGLFFGNGWLEDGFEVNLHASIWRLDDICLKFWLNDLLYSLSLLFFVFH